MPFSSTSNGPSTASPSPYPAAASFTPATRPNLISLIPPCGTRHPHFRNLASGSLISVGQLCNAGCIASFDAHAVTITHNDSTIITDTRSPHTRLWHLSLAVQAQATLQIQHAPPTHASPQNTANSASFSATPADLVAFLPALKRLRLSPRQNFSLDSSPGHRPGTNSVPTDEAKAKSHRRLETLLVN
jgi:hypothetical protein